MRIRRIINQNLKRIIFIILVIVIIFAIIQALNYIAKTKNSKDSNMDINKGEHIELDKSIQPIISQNTNATLEEIIEYKDKVNEFIKLCNEKETEQAYKMLSKECKEIMYPDYYSFYNNYCKNNFSSNKSYSIQNWTNNIFKVDIQEDILSTGGKMSDNIQDFISVVLEDEEYKLHINSYIGSENINKETIQDNIVFKVVKKDIHMKYEKYYLEITNNGDKDVLLDNLNNTSTLYLVDANNIKYTMTSDELTKEQLYIRKGVTMKMTIKFTNAYTVSRTFKNIVFSNAVIIDEGKSGKNLEYKVNL